MMKDLEEIKETLENRLEKMKTYLLLKFEEGDYHGVADAAMDIREIEAQLNLIEKLERPR